MGKWTTLTHHEVTYNQTNDSKTCAYLVGHIVKQNVIMGLNNALPQGMVQLDIVNEKWQRLV